MSHIPHTSFTGKTYPPKTKVRPCSAPTGKQQLAIKATRREMHQSTPRRCPQSGGKSRLYHIIQLEEKNKSLQEELKKRKKENSEMWNIICDLEDKHGNRHIPEAWSTHRHDSYRHLDYQDEKEYITRKGEKLNVNHKKLDGLDYQDEEVNVTSKGEKLNVNHKKMDCLDYQDEEVNVTSKGEKLNVNHKKMDCLDYQDEEVNVTSKGEKLNVNHKKMDCLDYQDEEVNVTSKGEKLNVNHKKMDCLDYQDEEVNVISKGEKLNVNRQNIEALWEELECSRSENDTLKREKDSLTRKIHFLQMELENHPSLEESQRLRRENNTLKRNIYSLEKKLENHSREHNDPYDKDRWIHLWQRKLDDKERELKKTQEENRQIKERVNEKSRELQQALKSKSQQYIDFQNELQLAQERSHTKEDNYKSPFKDKLEEKERELSVLNQEIMRKNQTNTDLRKEIDTLKKKALDTEFEKNELKTRLQRQEAHNEFLNEETAKLKKNMINLQGEHESLQQDKEQYITRQESSEEMYQKVLDATKEENEKLQNKVYRLERHMRETKIDEEKIKDISTEKRNLELVIQSLCKQVSEWKTGYHQIEKERDKDLESKSEKELSYERQLSLLKEEFETIKKEKEEKEILCQKCKQLEDEKKIDMKSKSEREQSSGRELLQVKQDNERLQKENEDLVKEKAKLDKNTTSQLKKSEQDLATVKSDLHLKDKLLKEKETELEKLKSEKKSETTSLNMKLESLTEENQDLERKLTNLKSMYQQSEGRLMADLKKQQEDNLIKKTEILRLQQDIQHLQDTTDVWHQEKYDIMSRYHQSEGHLMADLKKQQEDNLIKKTEILRLQEDIQQLKDTTDDWQQEKHDIMSRHHREHEEIKELLQTQKHENVSLKMEVQKLKQTIHETERECQQLQDQNQQLLLKRDSNTQEYQQLSAAAKSENEILQRKITHLQKENAKLETRNQGLNDQLQDLNTREEDIKQSWQQIESAMQQKGIENEKSASRIHELEDRLQSMREKLRTLSNERDRLKEEKDNALTRANGRDGELRHYRTSLDSANNELHQCGTKLDAANRDLHLCRRELDSANKEIQQLRYSNQQKAQRCADEHKHPQQCEGDMQQEENGNFPINNVRKASEINAKLCGDQDRLYCMGKEMVTSQKGKEILNEEKDNKTEELLPQIGILSSSIMKTAQCPVSVHKRILFKPSEKLGQLFDFVCTTADSGKSTDENETEDSETELDTINTLRDLFHLYYVFFESKTENKEEDQNNQEEEDEGILEILPLVRKQVPEFAQECIEFCRDIVRHNPPLLLMFDKGLQKGSRINADMFDCYKESGEIFKCLVWPALISKCDGSVYRKGLVKALV